MSSAAQNDRPKPDSTVVCRCEEVGYAEIRQAIAGGATTLAAIKRCTRAGMGFCQGRMCQGTVARLLAAETGQPPDSFAPPSVRPPVRPVTLEDLGDLGDLGDLDKEPR